MKYNLNTNNLKTLVDMVRHEDTTTYLSILEKVYDQECYAVKDFLLKLPEHTVSKLSPPQLYLLFAMGYKGGNAMYLYNSNTNGTSFESHLITRATTTKFSYYMDFNEITKEDLPYISKYYQNQWKKEHGVTSKRVTKGLNARIAMDDFSLIVFKESIEKPFNQTEAKNYVMSINKAFNAAGGYKYDNDFTNIRMRNKFYKVVIENTARFSKAMMNELHPTSVINTVYTDKECVTEYYVPEQDELIILPLSSSSQIRPFSPTEAHNTYADDLPLVPGNTNIEGERAQYRYTSGASVFLSLQQLTGCEYYKDMALKLLEPIEDDIKNEVIAQTEAINTLNNILKQGTNNE